MRVYDHTRRREYASKIGLLKGMEVSYPLEVLESYEYMKSFFTKQLKDPPNLAGEF